MGLTVTVDSFAGSPAVADMVPVIVSGQTFTVSGWAADLVAGTVWTSASAFIDGNLAGNAKVLPRADVAQYYAGMPALGLSGFEFTIDTAGFERGRHEVALAFVGDRPPDARMSLAFEVAPLPLGSRSRILVAAAPKSGSTFVSSVLQKYFDVHEPHVFGVHWKWEHNFDVATIAQLQGKSYVLQRHMRPYEPNVTAIMSDGISTIVTWRNLADVVVSLDDHVRREGGGAMFLFQLVDSTFLAMPDQARYRYLIQYALPWYINFYVGWKELGAPIFHYENLARDPFAYCADIIRTIAGSVDEERLKAILGSDTLSGTTRGNVGRNGRSMDLFTDETRTVLEDLLASHVQPLTELRDELPWRAIEATR